MRSYGISTLFLIFIVMCFAILSCLSLSTANGSDALSHKNAQHKTEYYQACNTAEEYLNMVSTGASIDGTGAIRNDNQISWKININENQYLSVTINLKGSNPSGGFYYDVDSWMVTDKGKRNYNQTYNLIR